MIVVKRVTRIILYSICVLLLLSGAVYAATVAEIEPNDNQKQAMPINAGDIVSGVWQYDGGADFYKLTLPQSGIATVSFSGPTDCKFQVGATDFGIGWTIGDVKGENGKPVTFSFAAQGNKLGYIWLNIYGTVGGATRGNAAWTQCTKDGPYYALPNAPPLAPSKDMPTSYEGKPVLPALTYQLQVTLQPLPDQYEAEYDPSLTKEQMLQNGMIKTIPIGQEITAYLFNEHPMMMKGTPGFENSAYYGGENDVDIYHVLLSQPDTVNVRLSNFPANANNKIRITQSDGQWDDSANDATQFSYKATKPGNVFIEISKGIGTGNLVYSTTPYKMLVTTGAATTPTVSATVTPSVTTVTPTVTPAKPAEGELITNGDFSKGLGGWTIEEWYKPSDGKGEVTAESDGIRFLSKSGNNRIGIMQTLNADVSKCGALIVRATLKADQQSLSGTGFNGREAPIAVFMRYTDVNGVVHGNLGEDPKDPRRMFWVGLYFKDPEGGSISDYGIKTQQGEWYTNEVDLMGLEPRPKIIEFIGAEGAGWATRDGKVKSISLTCVAASATQVTPTTTPTTTAHPVGDNYLYAEDRTVAVGENVLVPINIKNAKNIGNMDLLLTYDPKVLKATEVQKGSLTSDTMFESNIQVAPEIRISFASTKGVSGDGSIAYINFQAVGSAGSTSPVTFEDTLANEAGTMAKLSGTSSDGKVTVAASTAVRKGDVNGDGKISSVDALMALKMSVGTLPPTAAADVNGDGRVTSTDAGLILQAATGKITL